MEKIFQIEPSLDENEKKEILEVMDSGWYTESSKTREFEKKFAEYTGSKYAVAVTSGTTALYMGLKSLGIGKGDEVIVPDLTFVASPNSIEMTGAKPIFVDINQKDLNLDISKIENLVTKKTPPSPSNITTPSYFISPASISSGDVIVVNMLFKNKTFSGCVTRPCFI